MHHIIIGSSAAGLSALEAIREYNTDDKITVITGDGERPYSRILTSYFLGDMIEEEDIYIRDKKYFREMKAEILYDSRVVAIDSNNKKVELASGEVINYDRLLIATGASPYLPPYKGRDNTGVFTLRSREDVREINDYLAADEIEHCLMLGGGLISLKAAEAFYQRGKELSFVIHSPQILSQMLDRQGADLIEDHLAEKGFIFYKGESVKKIRGYKMVKGVKLESGRVIDGDLVLIGKGVTPNVEFLKDDQLKVEDGGIAVNKKMETGVPDIYAAGDVALADDFLDDKKSNYAIWPSAVNQGRIAGLNMIDKNREYEGNLSLNALKIVDINLFTLGKVQIEKDAERYSVYKKYCPEKEIYRKLVFEDGVLVGAITVGETRDTGILHNLIKNRVQIENRAEKIVNMGMSYPELIRDSVLLPQINQLNSIYT